MVCDDNFVDLKSYWICLKRGQIFAIWANTVKESFDEVIISSLNFTITLSQVDISVALVWTRSEEHIPSWVLNHSVVWSISNVILICCKGENFPSLAIFLVGSLSFWTGIWPATLSIPVCSSSIDNRKTTNERWWGGFSEEFDWLDWQWLYILRGPHGRATREGNQCRIGWKARILWYFLPPWWR